VSTCSSPFADVCVCVPFFSHGSCFVCVCVCLSSLTAAVFPSKELQGFLLTMMVQMTSRVVWCVNLSGMVCLV